MMLVSQKCQYALRAIFELAKRNGQGPVKIAEIAEAQAIPLRFLEVILSQLKQAGFVASQRGNKGGYILVCSPTELTVGEVMRFMQGPVGPVDCVAGGSKDKCPLYGDCAFFPMWERVRKATSDVYDNTTFQDLVEQEKRNAGEHVLRYAI
jgi:Rrf2 family protein